MGLSPTPNPVFSPWAFSSLCGLLLIQSKSPGCQESSSNFPSMDYRCSGRVGEGEGGKKPEGPVGLESGSPAEEAPPGAGGSAL